MKIILSIDGGGARGIITSTILREMELVLGPLYKLSSLFVSTSVGATELGPLATGQMSAYTLHERMLDVVPELFHHRLRIPFLQPLYSRGPYENMFKKYFPVDMPMSKCITKFLCTSVNIRDAKTHYFKSWEDKDGRLPLMEAIERSFAAPWYFGAMDDPAAKSVWTDGGTGCMNCPVEYAVTEAKRQGWLPKELVHLLSLGCGYSTHGVPYPKAKKYKNVRQTYFYMKPEDGGLARTQVIQSHVDWLELVAVNNPNFTYQRVDTEIPSKMDKMDGVQYIDDYVNIGLELSKTIDYRPFKEV